MLPPWISPQSSLPNGFGLRYSQLSCGIHNGLALAPTEEWGITARPSSHRTQSTSQQAYTFNWTHCGQWEYSHSSQATSKGLHTNLHANVLTRPVWTGPKPFTLKQFSSRAWSLGPRSNRTRRQICTQICLQILWCCLQLFAMLCEHSNWQQCVPFLRATFASTSASCVNGALGLGVHVLLSSSCSVYISSVSVCQLEASSTLEATGDAKNGACPQLRM